MQRLADPNDRRGVIVKLTPVGRALADKAIARHFEAAAALLGGKRPVKAVLTLGWAY